jgi:hypothetical protein
MFVVRQDSIEITGKVVSVSPPLITQPEASPVHRWTVGVKPDPPHQAVLTTRNGNANFSGNIPCTVGVDDGLVSWGLLLPLLSNSFAVQT